MNISSLSLLERSDSPLLTNVIFAGTIRRYLEQNRLPQLVILVAAHASDAALLCNVAPAYFPRSLSEQRAGSAPPSELHERRIRIIHNPHSHNTDSGEFLTVLVFLITTLGEMTPTIFPHSPSELEPGLPCHRNSTSIASALYTAHTLTTQIAMSFSNNTVLFLVTTLADMASTYYLCSLSQQVVRATPLS